MLDPVSAASVPKPFERRSEGVLAASVDGKRAHAVPGRSHVGCSRRTAGGRSGRVVIAVPDILEMDVAAIHARWQAEAQATLAAVDRRLGIDQ
jgi:hypothetical protein